MASPLVGTKLFIPKFRAGLVGRLRLRERLKCGAHAKLTLISAPAGFGQTQGRLVVAEQSGHAVQLQDPGIVIGGIGQVLADVRGER